MSHTHAGLLARCPQCQALTRMPAGQPTASASQAEPPEEKESQTAVAETSPPGTTNGGQERDELGDWYLRIPEGTIYGPIPRDQLDQWLAEGRVDRDCRLRRGSASVWLAAAQLYPQLEWDAAAEATDPTRHGRRPHRGAIVLALGIAGWLFTCPIFAAMAWFMGEIDLREMRLGRMDDQDGGVTQAGRVMGIIYCLLWSAALFIVIFFLALLVFWRMAA